MLAGRRQSRRFGQARGSFHHKDTAQPLAAIKDLNTEVTETSQSEQRKDPRRSALPLVFSVTSVSPLRTLC